MHYVIIMLIMHFSEYLMKSMMAMIAPPTRLRSLNQLCLLPSFRGGCQMLGSRQQVALTGPLPLYLSVTCCPCSFMVFVQDIQKVFPEAVARGSTSHNYTHAHAHTHTYTRTHNRQDLFWLASFPFLGYRPLQPMTC